MTELNDASLPAEQKAAEVKEAPAKGEASIPLPPLTAPRDQETTPERLAAEIARLDWGLAALVLVLAFLLASFAARNSDLWMHLATGRLLAHGQYSFSTDPFAYTASQWINHSWLWDLITYAVATAAGGAATPLGGAVLVLLKALLVTALAGVMLQVRRAGQSLWAPAACAGLALLVMSPRLLLQPTLVSLLFLAVTLYLLQRPRHQEGKERPRGGLARSPLAAYWLLPPLFALWVNLDSWFVVGPLAVALYLAGQAVQRVLAPVRTGADAPEPRQLATLALVLLVGLAACLLNPAHYRAFQLPTEFAFATPTEALKGDTLLGHLFISPFDREYFRQAAVGMNVAGLAYFVLAAVGLVSFGLAFPDGWRWWRLLVWLGFGLLSAVNFRAVPFFAVVAGPITALNLQDYAASRFGTVPRVDRSWKTWSLAGRIVTLLLGVLLLLGTWPGWLHAWPQTGRLADLRSGHRVAWAVEVDPSLRQAAEQLAAWRRDGLVQPGEQGFNDSPDIVNYCAWFCTGADGLPLEKGFVDYRFQAFAPRILKEYVDLRRMLREYPRGMEEDSERTARWQDLFKERGINHVVLNSNDSTSLFVWHYLLLDWSQWALLYMDGRTTIFGWNGAAHPPRVERFNPERAAFTAAAERAPAEGPGGPAPEPQDLWTRFVHGPPPHSLASDRANYDLLYYDQIRQRWWPPAVLATDFAAWSGLVGQTGVTPATGPVGACGTMLFTSLPLRLALARKPEAINLFLRDKNVGPPGAPLLAVRAARRAIAASPHEAAPYFSLGRAYDILWLDQEEHWAGAGQQLLPRQKLRQVQVMTALENGLRLRPDDIETHLTLYGLYRLKLRFNDLALEHFNEAIKYTAAAGPHPGEMQEDFKQRLEQMEKERKELDTLVIRQQNEFDVSAANQPLLTKVQMALSRGLGRRALDLLLQADEAQIDLPEANLELELLLTVGRPEDVAERLTGDLKGLLGFNYDWYKTLRAAASGNYQEAGEALDQVIAALEHSNTQSMLALLQSQAFPPQGMLPGNLVPINVVVNKIRQVADFHVLRGLLALDEGDMATAERSFQAALKVGQGQELIFESRPIATRYLEVIQRAQQMTR